jgi:hypothetical protein
MEASVVPATVLTDLALALSLRPVAGADPLRVLGEVAVEVAQALRVDGVVVLVPAAGWVRGSDETATLIGEIQRRDGQGPLLTVMRTMRPMLTPDLARIGPPALAALAAEIGLTTSAAVAIGTDGLAALQLVGRAARPVENRHVDALAPVLGVLAARIADMVEVDRLRRRVAAPVRPPAPPASAPVAPAAHAVARPRQPDRSPVRVAVEVDPRPLSAQPPELVTEEIRAVAGNVLPLQRRPDGPRARHAARVDGGAAGR